MQGVMGSVSPRISGGLLLLMALTFAVPGLAAAQPAYPNRPVRILVPYGPGGVADTTVRLLAQKFVELGYSDPLSPETIRQTLKKTNSGRTW